MISREDAIDNFKIALQDMSSQNINDYKEEVAQAICDMTDMQKIRKYMSTHPKFEEQIESILNR